MSKKKQKKQLEPQPVPQTEIEAPKKYPFEVAVMAVASLALGWIVAVMAWDAIKLSFHNEDQIVGPLTLISFNPANNLIRFVVFIILPSIFFLGLYAIRNGFESIKVNFKALLNPKERSEPVNIDTTDSKQRLLDMGIIMFFGCILVNMIAHSANENYLTLFAVADKAIGLDFFHDGEFLTPAFNYISGKGLYQGSFIAHGAFYDPLSTVLGWKLFNTISIGASRQMNFYLTLLLPLSMVIFLGCTYFYLSTFYNRKKAIGFTSLFVLVYIFSWQITQYSNRRDALVFLGLSLMLLNLRFLILGKHLKWSYLISFLIGVLSPVTIFYSIDRGFYFLAFTVIFALYMMCVSANASLKTRTFSAGMIFLGFVVSAVVFMLIAGKQEMAAFFNTVGFFSSKKDLIDSYVYPKPFSVMRFAKGEPDFPLMIASVGLLWLMIRFVKGKLQQPDSIFLVIFTILGIFYFRSGLGRSDFAHIMYASTFLTLLIVWIVMELFFRESNYIRFMVAVVVLFIVLLPLSGQARKNTHDALNFKHFFDRWMPNQRLISLPDDAFLPPQVRVVKQYLKTRMNQVGQDNFIALTSEAVWPYLLRVPSTSRFFLTWFATPISHQMELIKDIKTHKPQYLLVRSPHWANKIDNIDIMYKIPKVFEFVLSNYALDQNIYGYEIYKLK